MDAFSQSSDKFTDTICFLRGCVKLGDSQGNQAPYPASYTSFLQNFQSTSPREFAQKFSYDFRIVPWDYEDDNERARGMTYVKFIGGGLKSNWGISAASKPI